MTKRENLYYAYHRVINRSPVRLLVVICLFGMICTVFILFMTWKLLDPVIREVDCLWFGLAIFFHMVMCFFVLSMFIALCVDGVKQSEIRDKNRDRFYRNIMWDKRRLEDPKDIERILPGEVSDHSDE